MKLRTKFLALLGVLLLVLSAANLGALALYQQNLVDQNRQSVDRTANQTAEQISRLIDTRTDTLSVSGQRYPDDDLSRAGSYYAAFINTSEFFIASVMNEDGEVVALAGPFTAEGRQEELGTDYSGETYFQRAIDGQVHITQPQEGRYEEFVTISAPIYATDGSTIIGVVQAGIRVDAIRFFPMLFPLESPTQTVSVATADGQVLRETQKSFDRSFSGSATVPEVNWRVTVSRDRAPVDQQVRRLLIQQAVTLLLVLGAVGGFGIWDYRSNLAQTERLLRSFQRIKEGDYSHRLDITTAEEWRQISEGFNDLARGLAIREAELLEREQRLGVLNRVIRHNVRNEMSVILNYSDLIRETSDDDRARTAAETISSTGRKLADLSETAREIEEALESAEEGLVKQDAVPIAEEAAGTVADDYPEVEVRTDLPESVSIAAIPSLSTAVRNVCENACEHNDAEDPWMEVAVEEVERDGEAWVDLSVADNGPGIPEQEKNVLIEGRETSLQHGSGLGLWLIYWVVDKSDGILRFDENEPRGSVVTMELHASAPEEIDPSRPIPDAEPVAPENVESQGAVVEAAGAED